MALGVRGVGVVGGGTRAGVRGISGGGPTAMITPGVRGIADGGVNWILGAVSANGGLAAALALDGFAFGFGSTFGLAFPTALTTFAFGATLAFAPCFAQRGAEIDAGRFMVWRLAPYRRLRSTAISQLLPMRNVRPRA